jgi:hypothetical protein
MKYIILILLCLHIFACMRLAIKLNYSHPNALSAEYFINHTKERFIEDHTKGREWTKEELLLKAFDFSSTTSSSIVHILFFDSQTTAIGFERANNFGKSDTLRSVLNGAVLSVIQSDDKHKSAELADWFAGKE